MFLIQTWIIHLTRDIYPRDFGNVRLSQAVEFRSSKLYQKKPLQNCIKICWNKNRFFWGLWGGGYFISPLLLTLARTGLDKQHINWVLILKELNLILQAPPLSILPLLLLLYWYLLKTEDYFSRIHTI